METIKIRSTAIILFKHEKESPEETGQKTGKRISLSSPKAEKGSGNKIESKSQSKIENKPENKIDRGKKIQKAEKFHRELEKQIKHLSRKRSPGKKEAKKLSKTDNLKGKRVFKLRQKATATMRAKTGKNQQKTTLKPRIQSNKPTSESIKKLGKEKKSEERNHQSKPAKVSLKNARGIDSERPMKQPDDFTAGHIINHKEKHDSKIKESEKTSIINATLTTSKAPVSLSQNIRTIHTGIPRNQITEKVLYQQVSPREFNVKIHYMIENGGGTARFQISPPDLGKLEVRVKVFEGKVSLDIKVQDPKAITHLNSMIDQIREDLASRNLVLQESNFSLMNNSQSGTGNGYAKNAEEFEYMGYREGSYHKNSDPGDRASGYERNRNLILEV